MIMAADHKYEYVARSLPIAYCALDRYVDPKSDVNICEGRAKSCNLSNYRVNLESNMEA